MGDERDERDRRGRKVTSEATGARRLTRAAGGRRHVITVKVDDDEFERISERAAAEGVSRQRVLVEAALADVGDDGLPAMTTTQYRAMLREFFAARRQVGGMAINLNQLARAANATGQPPDDLAAALAAIERTLARLDESVAAITPRPRRRKAPVAAPAPEANDLADVDGQEEAVAEAPEFEDWFEPGP